MSNEKHGFRPWRKAGRTLSGSGLKQGILYLIRGDIMKLRTLSVLSALALTFASLASCDNNPTGSSGTADPNSIRASVGPVTGISSVPASVAVNETVDLGVARVMPGDAANMPIVWALKTAGAGITSVPENGILTPTEQGIFTITAVVADGVEAGVPFVRDFPIAVSVPPTDLTELRLAPLNGKIVAVPGGSIGAESFVFRIGTTADPDSAAESDNPGLSGLENDVTYYVWAKARNPFGDSLWFGPVSTVPSAVRILAADNAADALAELDVYLRSLPTNTPDTAYAVKFAPGVNMGGFWGQEGEDNITPYNPGLQEYTDTYNDNALKKLLDVIGTGKYVFVDMSDCVCDYSVNGPVSSTARNVIPTSGTIKYASYIVGIVLPDSIKRIGNKFMAHHSSLVSINFPQALQSIGDHAFWETGITRAVFQGNVTAIGGRAFSDCAFLEVVDFGGSQLQSIGDRAFANTAIKEITLPEGIEARKFGEYVFLRCASLETVNLPADMTVIPFGTFDGTTSLKNINLDKIISIGVFAFQESGISSVNLPAIKSLGEGAFRVCDNLRSVTLGSGLTRLLSDTFQNCANLETINLENITEFGDKTGRAMFIFANCVSLTSVDLSSLARMDDFGIMYPPFKGCTSLETVVLGHNLAANSDVPFSDCTALASVYVPDETVGAYKASWNAVADKIKPLSGYKAK
jgi:hypothetical protein